MSTKRRETAKTLRNADGVIVCSCGCGQIPQKPRRTWFSDECVNRWREINDPAYIRQKVFARDRGICADCGVDSEKAYRQWQANRRQVIWFIDWLERNERHNVMWVQGRMICRPYVPMTHAYTMKRRKELREKWDALGNWTPGRSSGWDADHIVPVVEGGGLCGLENYRTLCHPCHKKATAALAARRAKKKLEPTPELQFSP